jgi:hypothetical protein
MFTGFATIGEAFEFPVLTDVAGVPTNSSTTPSYRVYGSTGLVASGSLSFKETGTVTGATNASPIVITAASHGLTTGMKVTIASVGGNTAANGTFTITVVNANSFSLDSSTGNGAYTSGGTWKVTGLYTFTVTPSLVGGYAAGGWYSVLVIATITADVWEKTYRFGVT